MVNATILANNSNITTYDQMLAVANQITDGIFPIGILIAFWFITFLALSTHDVKRAFFATNLATTLIAVLFLTINAINPLVAGIMITLTLISFGLDRQ